MNGTFPATITAVKTVDTRTDILIELEYIGSAITTTFGENIAAGKLYTFSFKNFFNRSISMYCGMPMILKCMIQLKQGLFFRRLQICSYKKRRKQLSLIMHGGVE
jgi:hypothetical protein